MKKKRGINLVRAEIIDSAIEKGIGVLLEDHPRFRKYQEDILENINRKELRKKKDEIYENIRERNWSDKKKRKYILKELANYVATGIPLYEPGQTIILRKGLEERAAKGFFKKRFARRRLKGEKYLDNAIEAAEEGYYLLKKGNLKKHLPEFKKNLWTLKKMGFLDNYLSILQDYGVFSQREASRYKKTIREIAKEKVGESKKIFGKTIEEYITPQKVAASILLVLGAGLILLSSINITGMVIGGLSNLSDVYGGLIGIFLILISLILFFKAFQK